MHNGVQVFIDCLAVSIVIGNMSRKRSAEFMSINDGNLPAFRRARRYGPNESGVQNANSKTLRGIYYSGKHLYTLRMNSNFVIPLPVPSRNKRACLSSFV